LNCDFVDAVCWRPSVFLIIVPCLLLFIFFLAVCNAVILHDYNLTQIVE